MSMQLSDGIQGSFQGTYQAPTQAVTSHQTEMLTSKELVSKHVERFHRRSHDQCLIAL